MCWLRLPQLWGSNSQPINHQSNTEPLPSSNFMAKSLDLDEGVLDLTLANVLTETAMSSGGESNLRSLSLRSEIKVSLLSVGMCSLSHFIILRTLSIFSLEHSKINNDPGVQIICASWTVRAKRLPSNGSQTYTLGIRYLFVNFPSDLLDQQELAS